MAYQITLLQLDELILAHVFVHVVVISENAFSICGRLCLLGLSSHKIARSRLYAPLLSTSRQQWQACRLAACDPACWCFDEGTFTSSFLPITRGNENPDIIFSDQGLHRDVVNRITDESQGL